jgi:hypothetical protein
MRRRELFKWLFVLPVAAVPQVNIKKYGRLDVHGHRAHLQTTGEFLHTWLDGVDVTGDCRDADDVCGVVHIVARQHADVRRWQKAGGLMVSGRIFELRGDVIIAPGPAFVRTVPRA